MSELQKVQSINTGRNNIITKPEDVSPAKSDNRSPLDRAKIEKAIAFYESKQRFLLIQGTTGMLGAIINTVTDIYPGFSDTLLVMNILNEGLKQNLVGNALIKYISRELSTALVKNYGSVEKFAGKKATKAIESLLKLAPNMAQYGKVFIEAHEDGKKIKLLEQALSTGDLSQVAHLLDTSDEDREYYSNVASGEALWDSSASDIDLLGGLDLFKNLFTALSTPSTLQKIKLSTIAVFLSTPIGKTIQKIRMNTLNKPPEMRTIQAEVIKASPIPEPEFTEFKHPEPVSEETTVKGDSKATTSQPSLMGSLVNGLNKVNPLAILKAKKEQALEKQRLAYAKSMKEYKAHIQRSIDRDPSMEYFHSSKYQEETQFMYGGGISCSNINPSEANNFSSPVGGSSVSPFSSLSNEIEPFKIPPFLTIEDILRNPKFKEFAQNIAGNEAHKQLCSYNSELHASFQEESPLSPEDKSTMEDAHDLIAYINRVGAETERAEKSE